MTDNVNHLILEHLKALRTDVATFRTETREGFRTVNARLTSLESSVGIMRMDLANLSLTGHESNVRMDKFDDRLNRIETRLGLVGGN